VSCNWHVVDGNRVLSAQYTAFVLSEMQCLLTSTGYGPRSRFVLLLGKSAMISDDVCVALFVCFKGSFLMVYDCIIIYFSAVIHG
jgi:hypothetical protein